MKIQYIIESGDKPFLTKARDKRDHLLVPRLSSLTCPHAHTQSIITLYQKPASYSGGSPTVGINLEQSCCPEFKALIESKL